jgi:hypothetical protein
MATSQVTIKIPYNLITTISAEHSIGYKNGKLSGNLSLASSATEEGKQAGSRLNIPLSGLPETAVIKSVKIPITNEISGDTAGNASTSYAVLVESTEYDVDANGNATNGNMVTRLNNYKAQHGVFPDITFIAGSWVYRPSSGTATVRFTLDYPTIVCTVEGGQATYRPNADVSVGHEIPSGFSGVYQLLNETSSDGDTTCISSHGDYNESIKDETIEDKTSIVTIGAPFPKKTNIVQLRILASLFLSTTQSVYATSLHATFTLKVNDESIVFKQHYPAAMNIYADAEDAWVTKSYYLFEGVADADSSFVNAINNYYKANGSMPRIDIQIQTYAAGYYSQSDTKTTTGTTDTKVSQVYLEAVYEDSKGMSLYRNEGGTWKQAQTAYEKRSGAWIEISEDECKSILQNSFIINKQ